MRFGGSGLTAESTLFHLEVACDRFTLRNLVLYLGDCVTLSDKLITPGELYDRRCAWVAKIDHLDRRR